MSRSARRVVFLGAVAAALYSAGRQVYSRRVRERVVGHEGLDDPQVAQAYNWVATLPHMRLLRRLAVRRAVGMVQAGQAADLGCGPGYLVVELARAAPSLHITGIDLSDEMLVEAEEAARHSGLADRVAFKEGDAMQIPFPDHSLDLVVSTFSLHHWGDPAGVLDEIARVLRHPEPSMGRSGGSFLILDLRRDLAPPLYLLLWFATHCVVPRALRRVNEPLGSRDASFTPHEAARMAGESRLTNWRVTRGPLWLTIEGTLA